MRTTNCYYGFKSPDNKKKQQQQQNDEEERNGWSYEWKQRSGNFEEDFPGDNISE